MIERQSALTLDHNVRMQIDDWLRQADKCILAGRYSIADELLQKVFAKDPDNERAESFQERIQYLVKQLSSRVGLGTTVQLEVRKYNDAFIKRKANLVSSYLLKARKLLEEGNAKRALVSVNKALALDSENAYAKLLAQRVEGLQQERDKTSVRTEGEQQFKVLLTESWKNGVPPQKTQDLLRSVQERMMISEGKRLELERLVKNSLYKEALNEIWHTGGLAAFSLETVDQLRTKFSVSIIDHSTIEASFLKEIRKNKVKGTVLVVEVNEPDLLQLAHKLRLHSYAVIAAVSVREAIATMATVKPDIIISEIRLEEELSGFDLYEYIRSTPQTASIPFIFLSNQIDHVTKVIGKRLGVDEFLTKPVDSELLFATIDGKLHRLVEVRKPA